MTKNAALQSFFSSFGLVAFPASSVPTSGPEMPQFPYLTYSVSTDTEMERSIATVSLWYRSESWTGVNAKVDEISRNIGTGAVIPCDEGGLIIRKASPWAQPMGDDSDDMVKRKILMLEVLFGTVY